MTLVALGVRSVGLDFGVPLLREGDSHLPVHAEMLRRGQVLQPKQNQDNVQYPRLLAGAVSLLPRAVLPDPAHATLEQHLAVARRTDVQVRMLVALLAVSVLPATWLLARRTLGERWALLAAAIPATSLLHLNFSQQARPHAAFASLFLWTVLAAVHLRARPTWGAHALVGVLAGLCLGCLQSGLIALPVLAVAWSLREREAGGTSGTSRAARRSTVLRLALSVGLMLILVRVFYAFSFEPELMGKSSNHRLELSMFNGAGLGHVLRGVWNWDPQLACLLPLAAVGWAVGRRARGVPSAVREHLVLLSATVPYLLVICAYSRTYERFLLPLLPFAGLFIAGGLRALCSSLGSSPARALAATLVGLALLAGCCASLRFAWLRSQPDTLELASAWVRAEVDPTAESVFISPPLDLALGRADSGLRRADGRRLTTLFSPWSRHQFRLAEAERPQPLFDLRWLVLDARTGSLDDPANLARFIDERGPGVYVLEVTEGRAHRFLSLIGAELARRGTLEARFSPDPDPYFSSYPLLDEDEEVDDWPHVFRRILSARAVGPVIEVYRVH